MKKMKCAIFLLLLLICFAPAALVKAQSVYVSNPVSTDRLHLRRGPRKGADSLGRFYNGTVATLLGKENGFCHVRIGEGDGAIEGYMLSDYLSAQPVESALPGAFVYGDAADGSVPLYAQADGASNTVATFYDGMLCDILGDIGEEWVYVYHGASDSYGFLPTDSIVRLAAGRAGAYETATGTLLHPDDAATPIHLRAQPGTNARSLGRFFTGTQVEVLAREDVWSLVQIRPAEPQSGWMYGYIQSRFIQENTWLASEACYATLRTDTAVLKKGMNGAPQIGTLLAGARVAPRAIMGNYAYVALSGEVGGYVPLSALDTSGAKLGNPDDRLYGAQGLCVVDTDVLLTAYATCEAYYPLSQVNSLGSSGYAAGFAQGDCLILLAELGEWAQVYDGYFASFVPRDALRILHTGDFHAYAERVGAGEYTAGDTIHAGFYSYCVPSEKQGLLRIEGNGFTREYTPQGLALYSFYLPEGARVTVGEGGFLTPMSMAYRDSPFSDGYASGRMLVGANMSVDAFWAVARPDAAESYIVITTFEEDFSAQEPERIPILPADENGWPQQTFFAPAGCFIEFVGCDLGVNG